VIAAGLHQNSESERYADNPDILLDAGCNEPLARGLSFVRLDAESPEPVTLTIDNQLDAPGCAEPPCDPPRRRARTL